MGAQPASLLSVQESNFGRLSVDGSSSGETAGRFETDSVQFIAACSQQHNKPSLPETLLQHAWSWLFICHIALFLGVSLFHSPLPQQPFIAKPCHISSLPKSFFASLLFPPQKGFLFLLYFRLTCPLENTLIWVFPNRNTVNIGIFFA